MSEAYKAVPISAAREIAERFDKSQVAILAWDPVHRSVHTTTYGVSAEDKVSAAALGEICAKAAGCDLSQKGAGAVDFREQVKAAEFAKAFAEMLAALEHLVQMFGPPVRPTVGQQGALVQARQIIDRARSLPMMR